MADLLSACPAVGPWLERMREVSGYLWDKGWAERNAGNLSIDVTDCLSAAGPAGAEPIALETTYPDLANRSFLVTGTGRRYRDLARDAACNACILRLNERGAAFRVLWGGADEPGFRPTSEFPSHLRIHEHLLQAGKPERVVLHTHPTELIALTHLAEYRDEAALNAALFATHPEVKVSVPAGAGLIPYTVPGTEELALATVEAFKRGMSVALWQWHGVVAVGREIMQAFDLIDTLNKSAQVLLLLAAAGRKPDGLGPAELEALTSAFKLDC